MALIGKKVISNFENYQRLSEVRNILNKNAENTVEVAINSDATITSDNENYYLTGILKQVVSSTTVNDSIVYYPTTVIASYSDIIPNEISTTAISATTIKITDAGTFSNITAENVNANIVYTDQIHSIRDNGRLYIEEPNLRPPEEGVRYYIGTSDGTVYTKVAYTSIVHGEYNGITLRTHGSKPVIVEPPMIAYNSITAASIMTNNLTVGNQIITNKTPIAVICIAGTAPAKNTPYNLWVNTGNQTMSYRSDTTTATWVPLGAVFK